MAFPSSSRLSRSPPPESFCSLCNQKVSVTDTIFCSLCKKYKHYVCNGLAESTFRKMSTDNKGKWKCKGCRAPAPPASAEIQSNHDMFLENFKTEILEEVQRGFTQLKTELKADLVKHFDMKISEVKRDLSQVTNSIEFLASKYDECVQVIGNIKLVADRQEKEIVSLKEKISILESNAEVTDYELKKESILVLGVPETKNEDISQVSGKIVSVVSMGTLNASDEIKDIARLGVPRLGVNAKPRPLLIKFFRQKTRDICLQKFRHMAKEDTGGPGLNINALSPDWSGSRWNMTEHLPHKSRHLLIQTRKVAAEKQYKYVWHRGGKIFVRRKDGDVHTVIAREEDLCKLT